MSAVVTLWTLPSLTVMFNRFYGIVKYVREHASNLRTVGVQKEVKLTKICVTMIVTYLSLWIMFAVMVLLRNAFSSLAIHCAHLWAYSLAFSSFAVVPIEYMILDRRFITCALRKCVRKSKVSTEGVSVSYNKDLETVQYQQNETIGSMA